ncbi:endonuclease/exonuclease/phosphatase family protein [Paracoccus suum]|nr:endonuclease/exonuclease/phosphatase family protein [Paracoccus suum]
MRVVTYNIQYGKGRDERYDIERTAAALDGADIIGLQEVEAFWDRSGNIHQCERIAELLGLHSVYGVTVDIHKGLALPDGRTRDVRRQFGNAVLSRWPILTSRTFLFPKLSPANAHAIQRGITEATIATPLGPVRVYSTHFSHLCEEERLDHARIALELHRRAHADGPVASGGHADPSWLEDSPPPVPAEAILLGDLNLTPDSPIYAVLTGPVSEMYGRLHRPDGFVDTWTAAGHDEASGPTFYHGDEGWQARTGERIDYVLATPGLAKRVTAAEVLTGIDASDHQPLAVTFEV